MCVRWLSNSDKPLTREPLALRTEAFSLGIIRPREDSFQNMTDQQLKEQNVRMCAVVHDWCREQKIANHQHNPLFMGCILSGEKKRQDGKGPLEIFVFPSPHLVGEALVFPQAYLDAKAVRGPEELRRALCLCHRRADAGSRAIGSEQTKPVPTHSMETRSKKSR